MNICLLHRGFRLKLPFTKLDLTSKFGTRAFFATQQLDSKHSVPFSSLHCQQLVNIKHLQLIPQRNLNIKSENFCGPKTLESYRRRDGMPKSYELIYRSTFPNYLLCTQIVIFLTVGAIITAGIFWGIKPELSADQQDELKRLHKQQYDELQQSKKETGMGKVYEDIKVKYEVDDKVGTSPGLGDLADAEPYAPLMLTGCILAFGASLFRILRLMPVRVYTNSKKHSVAILYGHVLPGRLTTHEFLAGTLRPVKRKLDFYSNAVYRDGSGKELILMEQFFRHPSDFNKIMGHEQSDITEESIRQRVREKHG